MKRRLLKFVSFMAMTGIIFYHVSRVLGYYDNIHSAAVFSQFYDLPSETVDAVWIGASSVQEFIIPPVMFEETGIALYSLAVGNEPFMASEFLIRECEREQDPSVYLVDIRQLAYTTQDDTYVRRITDNGKWTVNRLNAIRYMLNNLEFYHPGEYDAEIDYIFPFTKYHTRWGELKSEDFGKDDNCFFGYFMRINRQSFNEAEVRSRFDAIPQKPSEESLMYLNDFLDFCDTLDKKIIFTRTPNCLDENKFAQYNYIQEVIEERGYEVWDLNQDTYEMGIDYAKDFADSMHTNVYGAQKVSKYAAVKLSEELGLPDHRNDSRYACYGTMQEKFLERLGEMELTATTDFNRYLDRLIALDKNEYSVYIAVKDIQGYSLTQKMIKKLETLGLKNTDILLEHSYHSFVGIIANGGVIYQHIGNGEEPSHYAGVINGQTISMNSMTFKGGNNASIKLGGNEYAKNTRGMNFVVIDNKDSRILDSVAFDTHVSEITCTR